MCYSTASAFCFVFFGTKASGILAACPMIEPTHSCIGRWGPNHWNTRELTLSRLWFDVKCLPGGRAQILEIPMDMTSCLINTNIQGRCSRLIFETWSWSPLWKPEIPGHPSPCFLAGDTPFPAIFSDEGRAQEILPSFSLLRCVCAKLL